MKKSIFYLIANTLTNIVVVILLACITETKGYPAVDFSLEITQLLDKFAPMAILLIVEALSIILCAYECTSEKEIPAALNVVGEVVTIASIFYSLVAVVWVGQNYAGAGTVTQVVKSPFEAVTNDSHTVMLTGVGGDDNRLVQRAMVASELSRIMDRFSVIIVDRKSERDNINNTAVVSTDELQRMDGTDALTDLVASRGTRK